VLPGRQNIKFIATPQISSKYGKRNEENSKRVLSRKKYETCRKHVSRTRKEITTNITSERTNQPTNARSQCLLAQAYITNNSEYFRPHLYGEHGIYSRSVNERSFSVEISSVTSLDTVATITELQLYDPFVAPRNQFSHLQTDLHNAGTKTHKNLKC